MHVAAKLGKLCRDDIGGALLGKSQFRVGMDVAADRGQLEVIIAHFGKDRHRRLPSQQGVSVLIMVDWRAKAIDGELTAESEAWAGDNCPNRVNR